MTKCISNNTWTKKLPPKGKKIEQNIIKHLKLTKKTRTQIDLNISWKKWEVFFRNETTIFLRGISSYVHNRRANQPWNRSWNRSREGETQIWRTVWALRMRSVVRSTVAWGSALVVGVELAGILRRRRQQEARQGEERRKGAFVFRRRRRQFCFWIFSFNFFLLTNK